MLACISTHPVLNIYKLCKYILKLMLHNQSYCFYKMLKLKYNLQVTPVAQF